MSSNEISAIKDSLEDLINYSESILEDGFASISWVAYERSVGSAIDSVNYIDDTIHDLRKTIFLLLAFAKDIQTTDVWPMLTEEQRSQVRRALHASPIINEWFGSDDDEHK